MKLKKKAFTLVELIVVIAIIAILATTAFTVFTKWFNKARDSKRIDQVTQLANLLNTYLASHPSLKALYDNSGSLVSTYSGVYNGHIFYIDFNNSVVNVLNLKDQVTNVPKDPYVDKFYKLALAITGDSVVRFKSFQVGATLEYKGDSPTYNAYVNGNWREGYNIGSTNYTGIVVNYKENGTCWNGSTDPNLPYTIE